MDDRELRELFAAQQVQIAALLAGAGKPAVPSITVGQVYDRFEAAKEKSHSWRVARNRLRAFVAEHRDTPAMMVKPPLWVAFRGTRRGKISTLTINFELGWVKTMLTWAADDEQALIPSNPLTKARREQTNTARETWLPETGVEKLLGGCSDLLRAFVLVGADTGLRLAEIAGLKRAAVRITKLPTGERVGIVEISRRRTKNKKPHMVALTPRALEAIEALPGTVNPYVFASPYKPGRHYHVRHLEKLFRDACERSGVDSYVAEGDVQLRVHDLRHTAATAADRRGAKLKQIQQMLNHSNISITTRYVHHSEEDVGRLAALMQRGADNERAK